VLGVAGVAFRAMSPATLDRLVAHLSAQNAPDDLSDLDPPEGRP
jgi:hypothetical protein